MTTAANTIIRASMTETKTHILFLCPVGHLVGSIRTSLKGRKGVNDWLGSSDSAEMGQWKIGAPNKFDKAAKRCCEGH